MTSEFQFPGYFLEYDNLRKIDGWARTIILIKNSIKYKRRKDLETNGTSTIWIQVGIPGSKHFLLQALYRQFQRQGVKNSKPISSQEERWSNIIKKKWQIALKEEREIITLGDTNIDSLIWDNNWDTMPPYDKTKRNMYMMLKEKILMTGTTKINKLYTRYENQPDGRKSCLDHCFSTHPQKISSHKTHYETFSDHAMLEINKAAKNIQSNRIFFTDKITKKF